jgi:predicted O-linked N-acetylglucosamine transferase (SPINDLY family)
MESLAELNYRKGVALQGAGDLTGALAAYDAVLSAAPGLPAALYNKATVLIQMQRWQEALAVLDELVRRQPAIADAWNNRSGVLQALGRKEDALESIKQVIKLRPSDARALYNAGILLLTLKRFDEAQLWLAKARQIEPNNTEILGSLVSAVLHACDWERLEPLLPSLFSAVRNGAGGIAPLALLALSDDPLLQKYGAEWNVKRSLGSLAEPASMASGAYGHDRIRIGYLSSDFGDHPVAAQIVALLERHDRKRFVVTGWFTGRRDGSILYNRIVKACDSFHDIASMGSREAAAAIREAEIDLLVDLTGPTLGWRPAILKYRPAPIIAAYLGYAGTTGAGFIDYVVGDPHVAPFILSAAMTEKIVQLPDCFWPSDPALPEPQALTRADLGLPPEAFVFCCFNATHKIRPQMFDIWMRLLEAVPESLLWLRDSDSAVSERFRQQAKLRGIDPGRLHFAGRMDSFAAHLGRLAQADLFLDTFPYNAHASASDALWAGLPLVTMRGETFVSRVSSSLLANVGLEELIAATPQAFEVIARTLAHDRERLRAIRQTLAGARRTAPLFDMDRVVGGIEAAYLQMQARCGERPEAFRVDRPLRSPLNI